MVDLSYNILFKNVSDDLSQSKFCAQKSITLHVVILL